MFAKKSRLWIALILGCCLIVGSEGMPDMKSCKKMLRMMIGQCGGTRNKRSSLVDVVQPAREFARRKRQIMSIREIIVSSRVPMYDIPYPPVSSYIGFESAPIVPPTVSEVRRTSRRFESLPKESHSDIGFDTDIDEVAELIYEIFERMPRSLATPDKVHIIVECCHKGNDFCNCI